MHNLRAPSWYPDWSQDVAAAVASGPSASSVGVEQLRGCARVIAVNRSIELVPWADVWYGCDLAFWAEYGKHQHRYMALGVTTCKVANAMPHLGLHYVDVPNAYRNPAQRAWMLMDPPGVIGTGGNSGFQALNLCAQFRAKKILLVGFDMQLKNGSHWHGDHVEGLRNPEVALMAKWRRVLDAQANTLREYAIDVVNCSPSSALTEYRKATIEEALDQWNTQTTSRKSTLAAE